METAGLNMDGITLIMLFTFGGIAAFVTFKLRHSDIWDGFAPIATGLVSGLLILFGLIFSSVSSFIPGGIPFVTLYRLDGEIVNLESTIQVGDDTVTPNYIVQIAGYDRSVIVTDSRILSFEEGDTVSLNCDKQWNYAADPTVYCSLRTQ